MLMLCNSCRLLIYMSTTEVPLSICLANLGQSLTAVAIVCFEPKVVACWLLAIQVYRSLSVQMNVLLAGDTDVPVVQRPALTAYVPRLMMTFTNMTSSCRHHEKMCWMKR